MSLNFGKTGNTPASIQDSSGHFVQKVYVGVSWDSDSGGKKGLLGKWNKLKGTDLDLIGVVLTDGSPVRLSWGDTQSLFDGAIVHSTDNTTGKGDGDDEWMRVSLDDFPSELDNPAIVIMVSAYKEGVTFSNVSNVTVSLKDDQSGEVLKKFYPPIDSSQNCIIVAKLFKEASEWKAVPITKMDSARSRNELLAVARRHAHS